ncbi:hypothetical protein [Undibacterium sp. Tian12W]|uniref:hypothetical protein n=1 Tax=Undibacterium sp. Tian12W TaxID=3413054 RepID=UPI003BEFB967
MKNFQSHFLRKIILSITLFSLTLYLIPAFAQSQVSKSTANQTVCLNRLRDREACTDPWRQVPIKLLELADYQTQCQQAGDRGAFEYYEGVLRKLWYRSEQYDAAIDRGIASIEISLMNGGRGGVYGSPFFLSYLVPPEMRKKNGAGISADGNKALIDAYAGLIPGFKHWVKAGIPVIEKELCAHKARLAISDEKKLLQLPMATMTELEKHTEQFGKILTLAENVSACSSSASDGIEWGDFFDFYEATCEGCITEISDLARRQLRLEIKAYKHLILGMVKIRAKNEKPPSCETLEERVTHFKDHVKTQLVRGTWIPLDEK